MATNDMKLTGTNQAQNQYLNYYNQTQKYLGSNAPTIQAPQIQAPQALQYQAVAAPSKLNANLIQAPSQLNAAQIASPGAVKTAQVATPGALQAAQVASPGTLQASLVNAPTTNLSAPTLAAPNKINVERINTDMQSQAELANQIAAYLRPYTENAINARKHQTIQNRAAIDVDAASRGMTPSTWVTDAKLRQAQAEASDIANIENQYLSNLYQGVFNADQAQRERDYNAAAQNASAQNTANLNYAKLLHDYNTTKADLDWQARSSAAQYAYDAAKTNAANQMAAGEFNIGNRMNANQLNAQLAQQAAVETYGAGNNAALENANILNDAYRLGYTTQAGVNDTNAQLRQAANLAYFNAMNERDARNAAYRNQFDMYNNDNAYNAGIAERAYRDALAAQGIDWRMAADQWNGQMAYNAAAHNADMWTTLQQLAWNRAMQLGELADVGGGGGSGGGGGGDVTVTGDEPPVSTGTGTFWSDLLSGAKGAAAAYDAVQLAKARAATPAAGSGGGGMVYDPSMMVSNSYAWSGYNDSRKPTSTSKTTGKTYDQSMMTVQPYDWNAYIEDRKQRTTPTAKHDSNDKAKAGGGKPTQTKKN